MKVGGRGRSERGEREEDTEEEERNEDEKGGQMDEREGWGWEGLMSL